MTALIINNYRQARDIAEIGRTMTVGELIEVLSEYDPGTPVMTCGFDGNLYSAVDWDAIEEVEE